MAGCVRLLGWGRCVSLWLRLASAVLLLTGCLARLDTFASAARKAPGIGSDPVQAEAAQGVAAPDIYKASQSAQSAPADAHAPGHLYFVIADRPGRYDGGWRLQVLAAARQQGFIPFLTGGMHKATYLKAQLWPDRYHVRVLAQRPHYDGWVQVDPGGGSVVYVDPSSGAVSVLQGDEAARLLTQSGSPARELRLRQTYRPLHIAMPAELEGRYYGPRNGDAPKGSGRLDLFQKQVRVATIEPAQVDAQGRFVGEPVFVDGRKTDGAFKRDNGLEDGATTEYPDGRIFKGKYDGIEPRDGTMQYPDGRSWSGAFEHGQPVGEGRLTLADGTVVLKAPRPEMPLDGVYDCVMPNGRKLQCRYVDGDRIVSRADYARRVEARRAGAVAAQSPLSPPPGEPEATEASSLPAPAEQAAPGPQAEAKAAPSPSAAPPETAAAQAPPPAMAQSSSGCGRVNGRYATSTGLSKLVFDGRGRGHLWQHTYGGARSYTFDIDFRYSGSHGSMRFEYEEGIYRDTGGRELSRQKIPGGSASCSYDGRVLNIGGTKYFKQ